MFKRYLEVIETIFLTYIFIFNRQNAKTLLSIFDLYIKLNIYILILLGNVIF